MIQLQVSTKKRNGPQMCVSGGGKNWGAKFKIGEGESNSTFRQVRMIFFYGDKSQGTKKVLPEKKRA